MPVNGAGTRPDFRVSVSGNRGSGGCGADGAPHALASCCDVRSCGGHSGTEHVRQARVDLAQHVGSDAFAAPGEVLDEEHELLLGGDGRKASEAFGIPFLGEIPLELRIREGGDAGVPIVASHPDSREARAFMEMARNIAGRISTVNLSTVQLPVMA